MRSAEMMAAGCAAWLLAQAAVGAEPGIVLVENGTNACPIYAAAAGTNAAARLAKCLKQISGADFAVQFAEQPPEGRAICVGYPDAGAAKLRGDGYVLRVAGERLDIASPTGLGVSYGVFALLEDRLGCRWWSLDEEDVPSNSTIRLAPFETVAQPAFTQIELMNREVQTKRNDFVFKSRAQSTDQFTGSHTIYSLLTPYAKTHPEIYPLDRRTGKRAPNQIHFCYSDPGIVDALVEALTQEVHKRKDNLRDFIYMAGMGDSYGGECECDRCQAIYLEEGYDDTNGVRRGIIGGTNLRMINSAAEILDRRFPGIRVGTMAYMSMEAPPTKTVPRTNVYFRVPHLRHCIIHPAETCRSNAGYVRNLRRWGELAPGRVYVWDYAVNFGENFLYPTPVLNSISDNLRFYAGIGIGGLVIQGNYVSTGSDLVVLKNYVWRRLFWDTSLKTADLVREFCEGYYGPAAAPLTAYVAELEQGATDCAVRHVHLNEFAERPAIAKAYLTPERMAALRALADKARRAAAGREPFARRVEEAVVSLDAFDLWHPGPLAERDGRLVRTDLADVAPPDGWTFDRALKVCEFSRKSSPREWGTYAHYQELFRALHGGPLPALKRGTLEVKVAPAIGLRIRQISFRGKPLLSVPDNFNEAGWPNLGGAGERMYPSWTYGTLASEPTATALDMDTEHVSGSSIKQQASKRVELTDDGGIRITIASRRISRLPEAERTRCTTVTDYLIGKGATGFRVETLSSDGTWTAAALSATNVPPPKIKGRKDKKLRPGMAGQLPAGLTAVRIALEDAGCFVEDHYLAPGVTGGTLLAVNGVLQVTVESALVSADKEKKTQWFERVMKVK